VAADEVADQAGQRRRLVERHQRAAARDLDELAPGEQGCEPGPVLDRHHPIVRRPRHERGHGQPGEIVGDPGERRAVGGPHVGGQVTADATLAAQRLDPRVEQVTRDGPCRHPPERQRQPPRRREPQELCGQVQAARQAPGQARDLARQPRREVVEGLARREHEPVDQVGALDRGHLRATPVVGHEGHVAELEPLDQLGDQAGLPHQRQVGTGGHGRAVGAEGQGRHDAPVVGAQVVDDVPPHRTVHEQPVDGDDDGPRAPGVDVVDGAGGQLDRGHGAHLADD
jgi:hypothetical protein